MASEQYYDVRGNPFALSEGQYGFRNENGQIVYLNQDGSEKLNIRNLLYNQSWLVLVLAASAILLSVLVSKNWNVVLLVLYVIVIAYLTIMFRENGNTRVNIQPLESYKRIITDSETRADILKNIWLFIPLGTILYRLCSHKPICLVPIFLSVLIEAIQYFTGIGFCEFDDVISNTFGGCIRYTIGNWLVKILHKGSKTRFS